MNYERSLDEIIKLSKSKNRNKKRILGHSIRRFVSQKKFQTDRPRKEKKNLSRAIFVKPKITLLKAKLQKMKSRDLRIPDARMKIGRVTDARLKILKNRDRNLSTKNRSALTINKTNIADARLKIEAHKRKKSVSIQSRSNNFGVTRLAADGIIERKINVNSRVDNGVRVEYEDEDMNLEYENLKKRNWLNKPLVRRTVQNNQRRQKSPSLRDDRIYFEYTRESPPHYEEPEDRTISFKDLTRTIPNSSYRNTPASPPGRRNYLRKLSPVRQYSYESDHGMRSVSQLSAASHPLPMTRNSLHHLLVISNLHENVTGEDIKELFEDVGDLVYAKMIKSGYAEVAYRSQKDAAKAVEIYHNRQLDGMPMKCTLVSRHDEPSSRRSEFPSRHRPRESSSRYIPPVNTLSCIEPDSQITKKALFNHR